MNDTDHKVLVGEFVEFELVFQSFEFVLFSVQVYGEESREAAFIGALDGVGVVNLDPGVAQLSEECGVGEGWGRGVERALSEVSYLCHHFFDLDSLMKKLIPEILKGNRVTLWLFKNRTDHICDQRREDHLRLPLYQIPVQPLLIVMERNHRVIHQSPDFLHLDREQFYLSLIPHVYLLQQLVLPPSFCLQTRFELRNLGRSRTKWVALLALTVILHAHGGWFLAVHPHAATLNLVAFDALG